MVYSRFPVHETPSRVKQSSSAEKKKKEEIPRRWAGTYEKPGDGERGGEEPKEGDPVITIMSPVMYLFHSGFLQLRPQHAFTWGPDKNVLSLTATRCTFVHKHVPTEKAAASLITLFMTVSAALLV